jgi:hypothetical protein
VIEGVPFTETWTGWQGHRGWLDEWNWGGALMHGPSRMKSKEFDWVQ